MNMKNLEQSEESRGVILFAFNTAEINYLKIAENCVKLIKKHLNLPVTLITNENCEIENCSVVHYTQTQFYNTRPGGAGKEWKNVDRYLAYELSPYDTTLLIDCDYYIFTNNLLKYFDIVEDYLLAKEQLFTSATTLGTMGDFHIDQRWATLTLFKKTQRSKLFFELVKRVQTNYRYYASLYSIKQRNYRNDHAFTIAHSILNGYYNDIEFCYPETLIAISEDVEDLEIRDASIIIRTENKSYVLPKTNLHFISKNFLLSEKCQTIIEEYVSGT